MGSGLGCRELEDPSPARGAQIIWVQVLVCRGTRGIRAHLGAVEEMSRQLEEPGLGARCSPRFPACFAGNTARGPAASVPALVRHFSLPPLINLNHSCWRPTHTFEVAFLPGLSVRWSREGGKER